MTTLTACRSAVLLAATVSVAAGCAPERSSCDRCGTVVIAATGEPRQLLPPLVVETVGRDISDQVYERLADLAPGAAPIDTAAYRPALADRWERVDSLAWRFHLRPGARWQDGRPVTAEDVRFSFEAFGDSVIEAPARPYLAHRITRDRRGLGHGASSGSRSRPPSSSTTRPITCGSSPVTSGPRRPAASWSADTSVAHLVGSGPYRVAEWKRGEYVRLTADSASGRGPPIRQAIWRFATDPDAALNLVLSHEADVLETLGGVNRTEAVERDPTLRLMPYASATYGFLGFQIRGGPKDAPHPILGDAATRRALALAVDRATLARTTFGGDAKAPPGPMSQLLWIWDDSVATLPFDSVQSARALDAAGWRRREGSATRQREGRALAFDILVPVRARSAASSRHRCRRCGSRSVRR